MSSDLERYVPFVGGGTIEELRLFGDRLRGRLVQHVNSTAVGGGVAEILHRLVPLLREVGVDARWDVMHGGEAFFAVTKRLHNALHGAPETFTPDDAKVLRETTEDNLHTLKMSDDLVFIHDPQPVQLVETRRPGSRWIWRCHIDLSAPAAGAWDMIRPWVERYDAAIFSAPQFSRALPFWPASY